MTVRILADENVDHRLVHRLENYGHDVEHVDFASGLDKGADDASIAAYSLDSDRVILTSDDDFLSEFTVDEYAGLLFVEDDSLDPATVADIVHEIGVTVSDLGGQVYYVSPNWL